MTRTLELLDRLVAFPTVSAESNLAIVDFIESILRGAGGEVHRILDASGAKAGLFARIGPADGPGVMLSGHTDVVPVAGQDWTSRPVSAAQGWRPPFRAGHDGYERVPGLHAIGR